MSDPSFALILRDAIMYLIALVLSISVHEYGHAWIADKFGDPLPRAQGRVTLNPAAHIDPVGTILFPMLGFFFSMTAPAVGARIIGWGKPVQVSLSPRHLSRRYTVKTIHMIIAICGPIMNVLFGLFISGILIACLRYGGESAQQFAKPLATIIAMNIGLAFFNLIPCPPLDGGAVLRGLLPRNLEFISDALDRYGFMIFFGLLMTGALRYLMIPAQMLSSWWLHVVYHVAMVS
jgi:Zn-dependent protease